MKKISVSRFFCLLTVVCCLLSSCENFMDGSDIKNKLEEEISLSNTATCKVTFKSSQAEFGSFSTGEKEVKVGYPVEIQFNTCNGCGFSGLCAIQSSTGEILEDTVSCTSVSTEYEINNGIHKYKITLLKETDGVLVIGMCYQGKDTAAPEFTSVNYYNTKDTTNPHYREIEQKAESEWTTENDYADYYNHHVESVYVELTGIDRDSGIYGVRVTEKLLKNTSGTSVVSEEYVNDLTLKEKDESENTLYTVESESELENILTSLYKAAFTYNFKNTDDGLVSLDFQLFDENMNLSGSKHLEVQKDTQKYGLQYVQGNTPYNETTNSWENKGLVKSSPIVDSTFCRTGNLSLHEKEEITVKIKNKSDAEWTIVAENIEDYADSKGTKINNLENIINEKLEATGFVRSSTENSYLLIQFWSDRGTTSEESYTIPKPVKPVYCDGINLYLSDWYKEDGFQKQANIYYTFQPDSQTAPTNLQVIRINTQENPGGNAPVYTNIFSKTGFGDGIYTFYVVTLLRKNFSAEGGFYSLTAAPFVYYYNVEAPETATVEFPEISLESVDYSAGDGNVRITLNADIPDDGNTYFFKYQSTYTYYFADKTVILPSESNYKVSVAAYDSQKIYLGESENSITVKAREQDITPPVFETYRQIFYAPGRFTEEFKLYDKTVSGQNSDYSISSFDYYFVPFDYGTEVSYDFVSSRIEKHTANFTPVSGKNQTTLYFNDLPEGSYYLYIKAEDKAGNIYFKAIHQSGYSNLYRLISYSMVRRFIDFRYSSDSPDTLTAWIPEFSETIAKNPYTNGNYDESNSNSASFYYVISCFSLDSDNNWVMVKKAGDTANYTERKPCTYNWSDDKSTHETNLADYTDNEGNTLRGVPFTLDISDSSVSSRFIKLYSKYSYILSNNDEACFYFPSYICPDYYKNKYSCSLKSWLTADDGKVIFCDAPCLVHTVYSPKLLNNTFESDELYAGYWEALGDETGIVYGSSSFTYPSTMLDEVPEGNYYVTIAHFADGSVMMTEPVKK